MGLDKTFYELQPDGKMAFFVDATIIKDFLACDMYFYERHIKNLRRKEGKGPKPLSMMIGGWWSDVMESVYGQMQKGLDLSGALLQEYATKAWVANELDIAATTNTEALAKFGDLAGAMLMLKEYVDSQYMIDKRNWKIIAAEAGFGLNKEVYVGQSNRVVVYWVGKPDLLVIENDRLIPVDHKTVTKVDGRTIGRYKPGPQMPGYCFAVETIAKQVGIERRVDRCIVNICARERPSDKPRDGKKKPRFIRAYPSYTREEIEEWRRQMVLVCEEIRRGIETGNWIWRTDRCHNMYMRDCDYLSVHSQTPMARDIVLQADFAPSIPWRPYSPSSEEKKEGDE
jgi:hypothetical protein